MPQARKNCVLEKFTDWLRKYVVVYTTLSYFVIIRMSGSRKKYCSTATKRKQFTLLYCLPCHNIQMIKATERSSSFFLRQSLGDISWAFKGHLTFESTFEKNCFEDIIQRMNGYWIAERTFLPLTQAAERVESNSSDDWVICCSRMSVLLLCLSLPYISKMH